MATGYVVTIATVIVGIVLLPFVFRYLDKEQYAIFLLASDLLMWLGLLEIGVSSVLQVRIAQLSDKDRKAGIESLISTAVCFQALIAATVVLVGVGLSFVFPRAFAVAHENSSDAVTIFALMSVSAGLQIGTQAFSAVLIGYQQAHIDNMFKLLLLVIRTSLTVVLLWAGYGLISLGIAQLASVALSSFLAVFRARRLIPGVSISASAFDPQLLRSLLGKGAWFSVGGIAGLLIMNVDKLVSAKVVGMDSVTVLAVTGRLYLLAWTFIQQITNAARPMMARLYGLGQVDQLVVTFRRLKYITVSMAVVAVAAIWVVNEQFVHWWVGSSHYGGGALDAALALNIVAHAWALPNRAILTSAMRFVPENAISRIVEGLFNVALSVFLGLKFGLLGVVAATGIAALFVSSWYFPWLTARCLQQSLIGLYSGILVRLTVFAGLVALLVICLSSLPLASAGLPWAIVFGGAVLMLGSGVLLLVAEKDFQTMIVRAVGARLVKG